MAEKPTSEELEKHINGQPPLKNQLNFLSLAVAQSSEGIAVVDLDGKLEYLNKGVCPERIFIL